MVYNHFWRNASFLRQWKRTRTIPTKEIVWDMLSIVKNRLQSVKRSFGALIWTL